MRNYAGLLLFEDLFDYVPQENSVVNSLERAVFEPNVVVVETDCGTTLGKVEPVTYELEGKTELSTGLVFSRNRIDTLLSQGIYTTHTRTLDSCISANGICSSCHKASRPHLPAPEINTRVTVYPDYIVQSEVVPLITGQTLITLSISVDSCDSIQVFKNGVLLIDGTDFSVSDVSLTLLVATGVGDKNLTVHYVQRTRIPYISYLAETYSGSLLGMRSLPYSPLHLRPLLIVSSLDESRVQLGLEYLNAVPSIPQNYKDYAATIRPSLEKVLYLLAVFSIFFNVI